MAEEIKDAMAWARKQKIFWVYYYIMRVRLHLAVWLYKLADWLAKN